MLLQRIWHKITTYSTPRLGRKGKTFCFQWCLSCPYQPFFRAPKFGVVATVKGSNTHSYLQIIRITWSFSTNLWICRDTAQHSKNNSPKHSHTERPAFSTERDPVAQLLMWTWPPRLIRAAVLRSSRRKGIHVFTRQMTRNGKQTASTINISEYWKTSSILNHFTHLYTALALPYLFFSVGFVLLAACRLGRPILMAIIPSLQESTCVCQTVGGMI